MVGSAPVCGEVLSSRSPPVSPAVRHLYYAQIVDTSFTSSQPVHRWPAAALSPWSSGDHVTGMSDCALGGSEQPLDLSVKNAPESRPDSAAMDLSLPDKDAVVEVCYTCGTLVRRDTLRDVVVFRREKDDRAVGTQEPYFPSLLHQSRPAGSRPMAPDGRVRVCSPCHDSLLHQWRLYERDKRVQPDQRSYSVRPSKTVTPPGDFVCYICSLSYSVACRCRIRVTPGLHGEQHFADVLRPVTPPGAEGVHDGTVAVCGNCKRKATLRHALQQGPALPATSHCCRIIEESMRERRVPDVPTPPGGSSFAYHNGLLRREEVVCLNCRGRHQREFTVEARFQPSARGEPYFPFLATLPRPAGTMVGRRGALVCVPCLRTLRKHGQRLQRRVSCDNMQKAGSGSQSPPVHLPSASGQKRELASNAHPPAKRRLSSAPSALARTSASSNSCTSGGSDRSSASPPAIDQGRPMALVAPSSVTAGCYACHQPLEADRAYEVRTERDETDPSSPYFPQLLAQRSRAHLPAPVRTVAVCVFCFHTLHDQWARYQRLTKKIDPRIREYDTHDFICFVCSIRTYRKRLHLLDVKSFPFLMTSHRYPEGALLVCNKSQAIVCRDCHNTLNSQMFLSALPARLALQGRLN